MLLIGLPLLAAGLLVLPPRRDPSRELAPPWLPLLLVVMWMGVTAAHLYGIGYVYDLNMHHVFLLPGLWALAWCLCLRGEAFGLRVRLARAVVELMPALMAVGATALGGPWVLLLLGNLYGYLYLALVRGAKGMPALGLALTAATAVFLLPAGAYSQALPGYTIAHGPLGVLCLLAIGVAVYRREAWAGALGATAAGVVLSWYVAALDLTWPPLLFAAGTLLAAHALRWGQAEMPRWTPAVAAALWLASALAWQHLGTLETAGLLAPVAPALLLAVVGSWLWRRGRAVAPEVPATGVGIALLMPLQQLLSQAAAGQLGVLLILLAFAMFLAGVALACRRGGAGDAA